MIYYILPQTSTWIISLKNTSTNRHVESANLIYIALSMSRQLKTKTKGCIQSILAEVDSEWVQRLHLHQLKSCYQESIWKFEVLFSSHG